VFTTLQGKDPASVANVIVLLESIHPYPNVATVVLTHPSVPESTIHILQQRLGHQVMPIDSHFFQNHPSQIALLPTLLEQTQYSRVVFVPSGSVIVQPSTFLNTLLWSTANSTLHTMAYQDRRQMIISLSPDGRRILHRMTNKHNNNETTATTMGDDRHPEAPIFRQPQPSSTPTNEEDLLTRFWSDNFHVQSLCPSSMEMEMKEDGIPVFCPWNVRLQDIACRRRHKNNVSSIVVHFQTASTDSSRNAFDILPWTSPRGLTKELTSEEQRHCRLSIAQRIRRLYFLALQRAQLPPLSATELLRYTKDHEGVAVY
jgi:hypothetical protein